MKIILLFLIYHVRGLSGQDTATLGQDSVNTAILEGVLQNKITQHDMITVEQKNGNSHNIDELSRADVVGKTRTHHDDTNVANDAVNNVEGRTMTKDPHVTARNENRIDEFFRSHPQENIVRQAMLDVVTRMSTVGIVEEQLSRITDDKDKQNTHDNTDLKTIDNEDSTVESNTIDKSSNDIASVELDAPNHGKETSNTGEEIIKSTADQATKLAIDENFALDMTTIEKAEYTDVELESAERSRQPPLNDNNLTEFESDVATMKDELSPEHNTASNLEVITEDFMTGHDSNGTSEELIDHIASGAILVDDSQIDDNAIKELKEEIFLDEDKVENHSVATLIPDTLETSVDDVVAVRNTENSNDSKDQASQSSSVDIDKLIDVKTTLVETLASNETAVIENATAGMNMEWAAEDENLNYQPNISNLHQAGKDKVYTALVGSDRVPSNTINTVFAKLGADIESTKTLKAAFHEPDENLVKDGDNNAAFFQGRKRMNITLPIETDRGNDDGFSFVNIDSVVSLESMENAKSRLEQDSFEVEIDSPIELNDSSNKRYFQDLITKFHDRIKLSNLFDPIDADFEDDTPTHILKRPAATNEKTQNATNGADDIDDDRTLLDIFAESAKEFLTKKMFKETDPNCDWEWRSLRCEPALYCSFQYLMGDYHFGRSCRRKPRRLRSTNVTRISNVQATVLRPLSNAKQGRNRTKASFREISISDRLASLVKQTGEICLHKAKDVVDRIVNLTESKSEAMKQNFLNKREQTCQHLWTTATALNREKQKHDDFCFEANLVPLPTIRERILCGQLPDFPVCEDEEFNEFWKS